MSNVRLRFWRHAEGFFCVFCPTIGDNETYTFDTTSKQERNLSQALLLAQHRKILESCIVKSEPRAAPRRPEVKQNTTRSKRRI